MRKHTLLGVAGGALGLTGAGALVAIAVLATSAINTVAGPTAPAAAASLRAFQTCDDLLDWYVDAAVTDTGAHGWTSNGGLGRVYTSGAPPEMMPQADSAAAAPARSGSATGTNTQEADVDEPDVAKTDGRLVVQVRDTAVVISEVTGATPRTLSTYQLGKYDRGAELLLVKDHVLVTIADPPGRYVPSDAMVDKQLPAPDQTPRGTRILDLDIADPAAPRVVGDQTFSGSRISVRQYDDTVRLVTSTPRPDLHFVGTGKGIDEDEAKARNQAIVRHTTLADWLPSVTDNLGVTDNLAGTTARPVVDCADVYHPRHYSGTSTIAVIGLDPDGLAQTSATAVTADGETVYSSADRLYVATTRYRSEPIRRLLAKVTDRVAAATVDTQIHVFHLDDRSATYAGSGSIDGTVRDRWSMDEHDGKLRVAVAWDAHGRARAQNGIVVLDERHGGLVEVGRLQGLGVDEQIQSVRWFDDLAVLVTFRQTDPLYTVDLSDPAHPNRLGELKIPGYSAYLHPLGDGQLLGLGVDASDQGQVRGAQAAVFDIADLRHPTQVGRHGFGADTKLATANDPRAFTWLPDARTALAPVKSWGVNGSTSRLVLALMRVAPDGALDVSELPLSHGPRENDRPWGEQEWSEPGWNDQVRALPLPDGRVAVTSPAPLQLVDLSLLTHNATK